MGKYLQLKIEQGIGGMQAIGGIQNNQEKLANRKTSANIGIKVGNFKISKKCDEHYKK